MDLVEENKKLRQTLVMIKYLGRDRDVDDAKEIASKALDTLDFPDYPKEASNVQEA